MLKPRKQARNEFAVLSRSVRFIAQLFTVTTANETDYWNLEKAKLSILTDLVHTKIRKYFYRPFDIGWIYYQPEIIERGDGRWNLMKHITSENLVLVLCRQQKDLGFHHAFVTQEVCDRNAISINSREYNYYFPLYLYTSNDESQKSIWQSERHSSYLPGFVETVSRKLGYVPAPETIFYYIYATLHSPKYRIRYAEFLKIDFPRIPLTSNNDLFRQLSSYGEELVALHLMKSPKLDIPITKFVSARGDCCVDAGHPLTA
jgi:predicted helicase